MKRPILARLDLKGKFQAGIDLHDTHDYEQAKKCIRVVVEIADWVFPPDAEVDALHQNAFEMLNACDRGNAK